MSSTSIVLACVLLLVQCGSSVGVTEPGVQELAVLDSVLQDLRAVLETAPPPASRVKLREPSVVLRNTSRHGTLNGGATDVLRGHLHPWSNVLESSQQGAQGASSRPLRTNRPQRRMKRFSPTPPPSRCPHVTVPNHLTKMEQLRYVASVRPSGCQHTGCCHRRPNPCPHKPEALLARLVLLEERVREVDRLETRLKIYIALLNSIRISSKYPGEAGEPGPEGRKGHQGFKGLPGPPGTTGSCRVTGKAEPPTGPPGPAGNKGNPGPAGDRVCGCDGITGDYGTPGVDQRGPPGLRGLKGEKGERGRDRPILQG